MSIDPYYYVLNCIGFPDKRESIHLPNGFFVYLLCNTPNKSNVFVYTDRQEFNLSSERDNKDVFRLFTQLVQKLGACEQAIDLFKFYDSSELHKAHECTVHGKHVPVYRIRKANLRLYLVFVGADAVLFRLSTKRQDKLEPAEKTIIENRVKSIFAYQGQDFQQRVLS